MGLQAFILRWRLVIVLLANFVFTVSSFLLSFGFRFDFVGEKFLDQSLVLPVALLCLFRLSAYVYWNLNQGYWRYASTQDLFTIIKAHFVSTACFAGSIFLFRIDNFPRSVIFLEWALSILICGGCRLIVRRIREKGINRLLQKSSPELREVIVIGAGDSGHLLMKILTSHKRLGYHPVGVLDDSERARSLHVYGVPVIGRTLDLASVLEKFPHVSAVILAIPSLSEKRFEMLKHTCEQFEVPLKRVQSFEDIACLDAQAPRLSMTIESILDKKIEVEHEDEIRTALSGKSVLITGAGGSIGSELARQIVNFEPKNLILLDNGEYNLFKTEQELSRKFPQVQKSFVLASIRDQNRLFRVFEETKPDIVFHAAAYKHVPLLETNPYEAFQTNVVGTRNVLLAARIFNAEKFVLISTDKAVDPNSMLGNTKRIAEILTQQVVDANNNISNPNVSDRVLSPSVVRFGNVINSNGSVIPLFKEQILSGGPVTVTHPEMERFFMSIREAVRLVLTAGILGDRGEVYILDMGSPIRIVDVAKKMLALYGRREIPIIFTGIRPGEKLKECLFDFAESSGKTRFSKVHRISQTDIAVDDAFTWVRQIEKQVASMTPSQITSLVSEFVETFRSRANYQNSIVSDAQRVAV